MRGRLRLSSQPFQWSDDEQEVTYLRLEDRRTIRVDGSAIMEDLEVVQVALSEEELIGLIEQASIQLQKQRQRRAR